MATSLERTAYHEAGHAVCYWLLHSAFAYVTIKPNDDTLGHCQSLKPRNPARFQEHLYERNARARTWIERQAMVCAAGGIAEYLFCGRHNHEGALNDYRQIFDCLTNLSASDDEAAAYWDWLALKTLNELARPFSWMLIEATAAALLKRQTITFKEFKTIVSQADAEWLNLVRNKKGGLLKTVGRRAASFGRSWGLTLIQTKPTKKRTTKTKKGV